MESKPWLTPTASDAKLRERSGLSSWDVQRLRRAFWLTTAKWSYTEREALSAGGTCPRFKALCTIMRVTWGDLIWTEWLRYIEHSAQDVEEMCRGEYPISPFLIRNFSALFGIKVDFLLLGTNPAVDRAGVNIDVWPMTGGRQTR